MRVFVNIKRIFIDNRTAKTENACMKQKPHAPLFAVVALALSGCFAGCDQFAFDATTAEEKPLAAVIAADDSGTPSIYTTDDEGNVSVSPQAQTAITAAQTAAQSSGNPLAIGLSSLLSAITAAGAALLMMRKKRKQEQDDQAKQ